MVTNIQQQKLRTTPPFAELRTSIMVDQSEMLDNLVRTTGISKAALVRTALAHFGETIGYMPEGTAASLTPTRTGGPGLASDRKE